MLRQRTKRWTFDDLQCKEDVDEDDKVGLDELPGCHDSYFFANSPNLLLNKGGKKVFAHHDSRWQKIRVQWRNEKETEKIVRSVFVRESWSKATCEEDEEESETVKEDELEEQDDPEEPLEEEEHVDQNEENIFEEKYGK